MTPDLSILIGFTRGVLLSLRCACHCLHSGSWILSGLTYQFAGVYDPEVKGLWFHDDWRGLEFNAPVVSV